MEKIGTLGGLTVFGQQQAKGRRSPNPFIQQ